MVDYTEPMSWTPPSWHPDFGDAKRDLDHLRQLAILLIEQLPQLRVGLSEPEVGVMLLVVCSDNKTVLAEIYSIPSKGENSQPKYGAFLYPSSPEEVEHYTSRAEDVVDLFKSIFKAGVHSSSMDAQPAR